MMNNLRRLAYRSELGPERFPGLLSQATSAIGVAEETPSLLGQMAAANAHTPDTGTADQGW